MDARTLLLGDWSRPVRDPIDLLRIAYVAGVPLVALLRGDYPLNLTVSAVSVWAIRPLLLPRPYDLAFCLGLGLTGWGDALGLYTSFAYYDLVVHTLGPFFFAPVLYLLLARAEVLPDLRQPSTPNHYAGVFVVTLSLGLAVGAAWEIVEFASDRFLGTHLAPSEQDTATDLAVDGLGALLGAALLVVWSVYGWGSVRRIPGENRAEDVAA